MGHRNVLHTVRYTERHATCFQKLIPALRAEGHEVICAQYGLDTLKGDVDATIRSFGRVSGPIVLVGHSYGGTVITHAGMDVRTIFKQRGNCKL